MNHAFLIMAHDEPELLHRLINRLNAPNHFFFINIDKKQNINNFSANKYKQNNIVFLKSNRVKVNWGGYSQVKCEFCLLETAKVYPVKFDYYHLLSGHDYPIKSNSDIDIFFENANNRSYMLFDSDKEIEEWRKNKYWSRVNKWNLSDYISNKYLRSVISHSLNILLPRKISFDLYAGWQWWSWHDSLVEWVLDYKKKNPKFFDSFKYGSCVDEMVFHILLHDHCDELNIEPYNSLRFIDWHPKRETQKLPLVFQLVDYEDIMLSDKLFCRKVNLNDSKDLLEKIDKTLTKNDRII